jgi:hypothetical protein
MKLSRGGVAAMRCAALFLIAVFVAGMALSQQAGPDHIDITWMSISNIFYEIGSFGLVTDSASAADFSIPIVVDGVDYGSPIKNLEAAMKDAALDSVDLWIGTGGAAIARLVVPIVQPKAYLPVHWDGLYAPFGAGMPRPYSDPALEQFLNEAGVQFLKPGQYMDKWRLDSNGVKPIENTAVKRALGFSNVQAFPR